MPGSPATSPNFGAPRYDDADDATFSEQVNSVTDTFDALAVRHDDARLTNQRVAPDASVTTAKLADGAVTSAKIAAATITEANLAPSSVGSPEIIDGSIANVDLANNSVDARVLAVGGVLTPNLGDGQVTAAKLATAAAQALNAPGDLIFSAASARVGAVLCDGRAVSRSDPTYAALFAAIGTTYGTGDGSTTFNVPNYLGRTLVAAGQGAGLSNRALGSTFGEETHSLSIYEMPSHTHGISDPGHGHGVSDPTHGHSFARNVASSGLGFTGVGVGVVNGSNIVVPYIATTAPSNIGYLTGTNGAGTGISIQGSGTGVTAQANGNSGAHNVCQPSAVVNVFVKL